MKLYKVTIEYETVILAQNASDACRQAQSVVSIEDCSDPITVFAEEIHSESDLPHGWDVTCTPFGIPQEYKDIETLLANK